MKKNLALIITLLSLIYCSLGLATYNQSNIQPNAQSNTQPKVTASKDSASKDFFSNVQKENDARLQSLIAISESGSYALPINKDDLFCAKANQYTDSKKNVNLNSQLSQQQKAMRCGLTSAEYSAINEYTEQESPDVNAALRQQQKSTPAELQKNIQLMKSGMEKLAPYTGITVRHTDLPGKEILKHLDKLKSKELLNYPAFTSSSLNLTYSRDKETTLYIWVKDCKYISGISNITTEQEVICPPGTNFKVKAYYSRAVGQDEENPTKKRYHHFFLMEEAN